MDDDGGNALITELLEVLFILNALETVLISLLQLRVAAMALQKGLSSGPRVLCFLQSIQTIAQKVKIMPSSQ